MLDSRGRLKAAVVLVAASTLAVVIVSPAVVQYRSLHFDREYREFRIKARDWVRNPFANREPPPVVVEETIDTSLLRLRMRTIHISRVDSSVLSGGDGYTPGGSAMGIHGMHALIANRRGAFFEVNLEGPSEQIQKLALTLDNGYDSLRDFSRRMQGEHGDDGLNSLREVRVTDLLFLTGRESLAAAYTYWNAQRQCVTGRVALLDLRDAWRMGRGEWRVVYETTPCLAFFDFRGNQAGGRLTEIGPGTLYFAVGDFGHDGVEYRMLPQDDTASYGKIIEIDLDNLHSRVVSTGLRNPEGLTRDSEGRVWSTEHGPRGGDELNLIRPGRDYGWPHVTYGTEYNLHIWPLSHQQGRHDGYEEPVYAWTPAIGVSNLIEVRNFSPEWNGDLLVLSLRGRRLNRLRLRGERVLLEEAISLPGRLRDIGQLEDGRIVVWTDAAQMMVLRVETHASRVETQVAAASPGVRSVLRACAECHSFDDSVSADGRISLWGIDGRRFAAGEPQLYSDALRNASGRWTTSNLDRYLTDPKRMIPGTTMQYAGIADRTLRAEVVQALKQLK